MAYFAKVLDSKVLKVISADESFFDTFVDDSPGKWIQTSFNTWGNEHLEGGTPLRGNFAGIGYTYDSSNNVFYTAQPHASWTLDTSTWTWQAPLAYPDDGELYIWDEDAYQADNSTGWVTP